MKTREQTRRCGQCAHFSNAPSAMESAFAGLTSMGSGHASVRAYDGLCGHHGFYLSWRDTCADFSAAPAVSTTSPSPVISP